jgi:hypothetical protein
MTRFSRAIVICGAIVAMLVHGDDARGDGGAVQCSKVVDGCRVTVFTSPTPLRVGPADLSVLLADAATDAPLPKTAVRVRARVAGGGWRSWRPATFEAATNKLLRMAVIDFSTAGAWQAQVEWNHSGRRAAVQIPIEVGPPLPRWIDLAPWILWPIVPIGLFAVAQRGKHRRQAQRIEHGKYP